MMIHGPYHVSQPWLKHLVSGKKPVEGRKGTEKWKKLKEGDLIIFYDTRKFLFEVTGVRKYKTIKEYLEKEGPEKALPRNTDRGGGPKNIQTMDNKGGRRKVRVPRDPRQIHRRVQIGAKASAFFLNSGDILQVNYFETAVVRKANPQFQRVWTLFLNCYTLKISPARQ
jgi:ASC-1-like (ASCH) protein